MYGMCVVDDFLGQTYGLSILNEGKIVDSLFKFCQFIAIS